MKILFILFVFVTQMIFSQKTDREMLSEVVQNLFVAMKNSDSTALRNSFAKDAILQTISESGKISSDSVHDFVKIVGSSKKGILDERIYISRLDIDDNLASVWTPYEFYYNEKFSHCGVNSFQLVKQNGVWKIQYLIGTRRKTNCKLKIDE